MKKSRPKPPRQANPEVARAPARWLPILAVLAYAAGLAWRWGWVFRWHRPGSFLYSDMGGYFDLGQRLANPRYVLSPGDVTHPPGMSLLTAWLLGHGDGSTMPLLGPLQLAVSAAAPLALATLAWLLFGRTTAWWTLAASSLYFPFVDYAGYLLAENFIILLAPLVLSLFLLAVRAKHAWEEAALGLLAGVLWCVGIAFKLVMLPGVLAFVTVYVLLFDGPARRDRKALVALAMALGLMPGLVWISARATHANRGEWCLVSNKNGSDFLLGHFGRIAGIEWRDPEGQEIFKFGSPAALQRGYSAERVVPFRLTDSESNRREAWQWIRQNPVEALVLSCQHVYDLFLGDCAWPTSGTKHWYWGEAFQFLFVALLFIPSLILLAMTALRRGPWRFLRGPELLVACPLLGVSASVFMATGEIRYRIPWDGLVIILAIEFYRRAGISLREIK